jgi:drug/metabolite transporter (DMT)-like permease
MARPVAGIEHNVNKGILLLLAAQSVLIFLDIAAKWLGMTGMPTAEIVFMRYGMHVLLLLVLMLPTRGRDLFVTNNWKLEVLRGVLLLISTATNFLAMRYLPLTVTGALLFTSPLMVCALSGPLLGERVGPRRWAAIVVGFIGLLIIIRPGSEAFHPASIFGLISALAAACFNIVTRKLAGVDDVMTQQFYAGATALLLITPLALQDWVWPTQPISWVAFFCGGMAGMIGHVLISMANRYATPSVLAPFSYLQFLYLALASWVVFNEPPDNWFFVGAPIVICSGLYIWLRERQVRAADTAISENPER